MREIRAILRLKNNRLITAREQLGLSQRAAAKAIGCSLHAVMRLECLNDSGYDRRTGEPTPAAVKISAFHGFGVEYLFPPSIEPFTASGKVVREYSAEEALRLAPMQPDREIEAKEAALLLEGVVKRAEADFPSSVGVAIERHYTDDEEPRTYESIGSEIHLSRERVRQLQARGLAEIREEMSQSLIESEDFSSLLF